MMNAHKLADYLDNCVEAMLQTEQPFLDEAANLIRKQSDYIKELEQQLKQKTDILNT